MPLWNHQSSSKPMKVYRRRTLGRIVTMKVAVGGVAPDAPSLLTATTASTTQINLSWTDNSANEDGFKIERSTDGVSYTQIATVLDDVTTYSATGLSPNTLYYFRVRAYNGDGDSAYSNVDSDTTLDVAPTAPSGLTATAFSTTQINLAWTDNSSNETGFEIQRSPDDATWTTIHTTSAGATSYSATGLTGDTLYYFRVRAVGTGGNSAYTASASATTLFVPSLVTGLQIDLDASAIVGLSDGNAISSWVESVNGWDAAQGSAAEQPTYRTNVLNSKPVVRFDGSDEMALPAGALSLLNGKPGCSIFIVGMSTTAAAGTRHAIFIANNGTGARIRVTANSTAAKWNTGGRRLDADTLQNYNFSTTLVANSWYVVGVIHDASAANLKAYDGDTEALNTSHQTSGNYSATDSTVIRIGANQAGTGEYWNGDIARILVYDRAVTSGERTKIIDHLQALYAL